jgi:sensor domain CHASE-containing protein
MPNNMKFAVEAVAIIVFAALLAIVMAFGITISSMYASGDKRLTQAHTVHQVFDGAMVRIKEVQDEWDSDEAFTPR